MKLRNVEFGRAWNAAGARNFFGNGYRAHRRLGPLRPRWEGSTFVAKTTTLAPREGNMPLHGTEPLELAPKCIKVNFRKAAVLNAVGLSGPGLCELLGTGLWQARTEPFLLSFMATAQDHMDRFDEAKHFAERLAAVRNSFRAPFGIELNYSCPNVGMSHEYLAGEALGALSTLAYHLDGVPLVVKLNALVPVAVARDIAYHIDCDALCVSNTIPWGARPDLVDWKGLFGEEVCDGVVLSPLAHLGGGGLSGAPIYPLVREWFAEAGKDFPRPLVAGGGVVTARQAVELIKLGAQAIELGSVAIVRPWRVASIIRAIDRTAPQWS